VRVLTLGLQAGDRPIVNGNDRPGIEHGLIVPGHPRRSRIHRRATPHLDADDVERLPTCRYRSRYRSRFGPPQPSPTQSAPYLQLESIFQTRPIASKHHERPEHRILSPLPLPIGLWGRQVPDYRTQCRVPGPAAEAAQLAMPAEEQPGSAPR
jgi:hypothetical protein